MWKTAPPRPAPLPLLAELPLEPLPPLVELAEIQMIPASLAIRGVLICEQRLWIEGRVEGLVMAPEQAVTIGVTGQLVGELRAGEVLVMGQAQGALLANGRVEIRMMARVEGEIAGARLSLEEGAQVNGWFEVLVAASEAVNEAWPQPAPALLELPRPKVRPRQRVEPNRRRKTA